MTKFLYLGLALVQWAIVVEVAWARVLREILPRIPM